MMVQVHYRGFYPSQWRKKPQYRQYTYKRSSAIITSIHLSIADVIILSSIRLSIWRCSNSINYEYPSPIYSTSIYRPKIRPFSSKNGRPHSLRYACFCHSNFATIMHEASSKSILAFLLEGWTCQNFQWIVRGTNLKKN